MKGDRIVYSSQQGSRFDIWIMNSDGSEKMSLTRNCGDNENPSFSPDGRHIVFSSTRDGGKNIYVMDIDGSNQKRLTFMKGDSENPCWSPR
jgi:TolB protein